MATANSSTKNDNPSELLSLRLNKGRLAPEQESLKAPTPFGFFMRLITELALALTLIAAIKLRLYSTNDDAQELLKVPRIGFLLHGIAKGTFWSDQPPDTNNGHVHENQYSDPHEILYRHPEWLRQGDVIISAPTTKSGTDWLMDTVHLMREAAVRNGFTGHVKSFPPRAFNDNDALKVPEKHEKVTTIKTIIDQSKKDCSTTKKTVDYVVPASEKETLDVDEVVNMDISGFSTSIDLMDHGQVEVVIDRKGITRRSFVSVEVAIPPPPVNHTKPLDELRKDHLGEQGHGHPLFEGGDDLERAQRFDQYHQHRGAVDDQTSHDHLREIESVLYPGQSISERIDALKERHMGFNLYKTRSAPHLLPMLERRDVKFIVALRNPEGNVAREHDQMLHRDLPLETKLSSYLWPMLTTPRSFVDRFIGRIFNGRSSLVDRKRRPELSPVPPSGSTDLLESPNVLLLVDSEDRLTSDVEELKRVRDFLDLSDFVSDKEIESIARQVS